MEEVEGEQVGKISHYFDKISVAVVDVAKGKLKVGDTIRIKGTTTDFEQKIDSMQVEHKQVKEAKKGDSVGLKVADAVKEHDIVYKV
jgi:translation initiation factor IF-2